MVPDTFFIPLVLASCLWIGCGRESTTVTAPDGSKAAVTQKGDGAEITIAGAKGETVRVAGSESGVALPEGFPNASPFWPGHVEYGAGEGWYAPVQAEALRQIAAGLNTYTTAGSWSTVTQAYASEALARAGCAYFDNILRMKTDPVVLAAYNAKHGTAVTEIPITLQTSIGDYWPSGWDLQWNGVSGASSLFRPGIPAEVEGQPAHYLGGNDTPTDRDDPAEAGYIEVYHTCVQDEMTSHGMTLRELMGHNGFASGVLPSYFWCPNYRGHYYTAAMAKFEQYVKWLRPVMVVMDEERFVNSAAAGWRVNHYLYGKSGDDGLDRCSRCNPTGISGGGWAGYEAGKDSFAHAIIDVVHKYVPNAIVTFYGTYSAKANFTTEKYGAGHYLNFGDCSSSGITTGAPSLYDLSFVADPAAEIAVQRALVKPRWVDVGYEDVAPVNESADYWRNSWWELQPTALLGSYVWLTHCAGSTMDLKDNTDHGGYLTNQQFYDLCYALARAGAVGFYLYPGYHGGDCANDLAIDRLFPVGIAAFAAARAVGRE